MSLPNHVIGRYNFDKMREIGKGAFGTVYRAHDTVSDTTMVVKIIPKRRARQDDIDSEIEILSHLESVCGKHLLCFIGTHTDDQYYYIMTEYLGHYTPLNKYIEIVLNDPSRKVSPALCGKMIAHRDIKPENIMANLVTGDIKYIDFGLSCLNAKCTAQMIGSPLYMAPELFIEGSNYSEADKATLRAKFGPEPANLNQWIKADLWSLGSTIFEVITMQIAVEAYDPSIVLNDMDDIPNLFAAMNEDVMTQMITGAVGANFHSMPSVRAYVGLVLKSLLKLNVGDRRLMLATVKI
jgi:serine/threonine protein kinase